MSKRGVARDAGNVAVVVVVVIALVIAAAYLGFRYGSGGGGSEGDKATGTTPEAPAIDRFSIVVHEDAILVDGKTVSAEEAVRLAQNDGRPVVVLWKKAKTGAESRLKKALSDADIVPEEQTLE